MKRGFPIPILIHLIAPLPLAWLVWRFLTNQLTVNPIQAATQRTGDIALIFLLLSLACTPLNTWFGFRLALRVRGWLGLYAFFYALLHFILFAGVDYGLNWALILPEITEKRFILIGMAAFLILLALAITSFRWWMKHLGKNWKRLHRLVYLAGILVVLHYGWALKGDFLRLRGNVGKPLLAGVILIFLLASRIPVIRKAIVRLRSGLAAWWYHLQLKNYDIRIDYNSRREVKDVTKNAR